MAIHLVFLSVLLLFSSVNSWADVVTQTWPDKMWTNLSQEVDRSGTQLSNVLFEKIDEVTLLNHNGHDLNSKISVKRSIYDNQDILNSYTVNDVLEISLNRNGLEYSWPLCPSSVSPLNFNLGVEGKLRVTHLRQVDSALVPRLQGPELLEKEIIEEEIKREKVKQKWWMFDPTMRPRLSSIWNPFISLWRIPWTPEGLKKLSNGDLISYSSSGNVSLGLESGFLPLKVMKGVDLTIGAGAKVILNGEFRITLLKENERFVRVKLTRLKSLRKGLSLGAQTNKVEILEAKVLLEGSWAETKIPATEVTLIPFKMAFNREVINQFDIGYRYDLKHPQARDAFSHAMKGDFHSSHRLLGQDQGVEHLLSRKQKEILKSSSYQFGLDWILRFDRGHEIKELAATIQRDDGTREIFKSTYQLNKDWSSAWGSGEKQNFIFTTIVDKSGFELGGKNNFQLVSEAFYEDVNTSGKEMASYVHDIESVLGGRQVFPELPILRPQPNQKFKMARYKRSSFYFGQYFTQSQVMKFLMTESQKAWSISQKSFIDPKKAEDFYKEWMKLQALFQKNLTLPETMKALAELKKLFHRHSMAIAAMRAILWSLDEQDVDYFLSATNMSFGRIQFRSRITTDVERLMQLADETVDFENKVGRYRIDLLQQIEDLKIEQLKDSRLDLKFKVPENSQYLYIKILRSTGWKQMKPLFDTIYLNKGRFSSGENHWIIGPSSLDRLDQQIWLSLIRDDYYTLQLSSSLTGQNWGRVISSRFKFKVIEPSML